MHSTLHPPLNTLYTLFFTLHLPLLLLIDLYPLYPAHLIPAFMTDLRTHYIATYKDRFFTDRQPAWFWWFVVMEAVGHVPLCLRVWGRGGVGVGGGSPTLHLHLLLFAAQTALTTGVCIVEFLSWPELSEEEKVKLGWLYGPYFVFALVMLVDMYLRVRSSLIKGGEALERREKEKKGM